MLARSSFGSDEVRDPTSSGAFRSATAVRRHLSTARRRPTAHNHAAGSVGTPPLGQVLAASANASPAASSAVSKSRNSRARPATRRGHCSRHARSRAIRASSSGTVYDDRTHFHDRRGTRAREFQCLVQVRRFHQEEAAELLGGLGVRAVGDDRFTAR